jgi:hypothetical protein
VSIGDSTPAVERRAAWPRRPSLPGSGLPRRNGSSRLIVASTEPIADKKLSMRHNHKNQRVFASIVIVADRRVLDRREGSNGLAFLRRGAQEVGPKSAGQRNAGVRGADSGNGQVEGRSRRARFLRTKPHQILDRLSRSTRTQKRPVSYPSWVQSGIAVLDPRRWRKAAMLAQHSAGRLRPTPSGSTVERRSRRRPTRQPAGSPRLLPSCLTLRRMPTEPQTPVRPGRSAAA